MYCLLGLLLFLSFALLAQENSDEEMLWRAQQYASAGRYDLASSLVRDLRKKDFSAEKSAILTYDLATIYLNEGLFDKAYALYSQIDLDSIKDPDFLQKAATNKAQAAILFAETLIQKYSQDPHSAPIIDLLQAAARAVDILYSSEQDKSSLQFLEERILETFRELQRAIFIQKYSTVPVTALFRSLTAFLDNSFYEIEKILLAVSEKDVTSLYLQERGASILQTLQLYTQALQANAAIPQDGYFQFLYSSFQEKEALFQKALDEKASWQMATELVAMKTRAVALQEKEVAQGIQALLNLGVEVVSSAENAQNPSLKSLWQKEESDILELVKALVDKAMEQGDTSLRPFAAFLEEVHEKHDAMIRLHAYFTPFIQSPQEQLVSLLLAINDKSALIIATASLDAAELRGDALFAKILREIIEALLQNSDRAVVREKLTELLQQFAKTPLEKTLFSLFVQSLSLPQKVPYRKMVSTLLGKFLSENISSLEENISFQKELIGLIEAMIAGPVPAHKETLYILLESAMNLQQGIGEKVTALIQVAPSNARPFLEEAARLCNVPHLLWKDLGPLKNTQEEILKNMLQAYEGSQAQEAPAVNIQEEGRRERTLFLSKDEAIRLYLEMDRDDKTLQKGPSRTIHEGRLPW